MEWDGRVCCISCGLTFLLADCGWWVAISYIEREERGGRRGKRLACYSEKLRYCLRGLVLI
jgi:hypothetical protein